MAERFSCARASLLLGEPSYGTASQVRRWLLVEQPGSWGPDAVAQSALPAEVAARLRQTAREAGARLLLLRRHGRSAPGPRSAFAVTSTAEVRRTERIGFDDPTELLGRDWSPLRASGSVGGELVEEPLYLVCTNGKHDACCAEYGRPVAAALSAVFPDQVWEVSHIGGDRFAGNLVCLPDGIYYGRVDPATAVALVRAHGRGELDVERCRGRSFLSFPAQAAEHFVRAELGLRGIDDVLPVGLEDLGAGRYRVAVAVHGGDPLLATLERSAAIDPQQLTCRSLGEEHPPRYRLVDLAVRAAG